MTKGPYNTCYCPAQRDEVSKCDVVGCKKESLEETGRTELWCGDTSGPRLKAEEGMTLMCAMYNDIKTNNTSPDRQGEASRVTDSDMATVLMLSNDPGDVTCLHVNMGDEDDCDSLCAGSLSETPWVHIEGHSLQWVKQSIDLETDYSVPLV